LGLARTCVRAILFYAFVGVPVAGQLSDIQDLAGMVGVVGIDIGDRRIPFFELCFIGLFGAIGAAADGRAISL
jgi:hypothetical protein